MSSSSVETLDDSVGEMEILTGARLYHHLCTENESKQKSVQGKLQSEEALQETLRSINTQCRHKILAPVAQGMAYFDAELYNTNSILVLLGDGWFAQRSASQANEIAQRRVDFLQREMLVLREEAKNIEAQKSVLMTEITPTSSNTTPFQTSHSQKEKILSRDDSNNETIKNDNIKTESNVVNSGDDIDLAHLTDATLTTFDIHDELTEDELIELEHELGARVDDDEYVEQIITERMIAKKEKRVRAELARRRNNQKQEKPNCSEEKTLGSLRSNDISGDDAANENTKVTILQQEKLVSSEEKKAQPTRVECASHKNAKFATPGDIGQCAQAEKKKAEDAFMNNDKMVNISSYSVNENDSINIDDKGTTTERKSSTKRVTFAPDVQITEIPETKAQPVMSTHYAIGDVIEHSQINASGASERITVSSSEIKETMPELKPIGAYRSKRKSLFRREMEDMSESSKF